MKNIKYIEILKENKLLEKNLKGKIYEIAVISNIITYKLNEILEYILRKEQINAHVRSGDYDNVVQDSRKFSGSGLIIIFWELSNIINGFHYKINLMNDSEITDLLMRCRSEIDFLIDNLKNSPLVMINKFSALIINYRNRKSDKLDEFCHELNKYLSEAVKSNMHIIDIDKVISKISLEKSVDFRDYYSSKALYTVDFLKEYSKYIKPVIFSVTGKTKKALIFDCDNTLWKGILGEDGFNNIRMSGSTTDGVVFEEVQNLALYLNSKGVLLGLCSKNNAADVDRVLDSHPDMKIKDNNISIKMVNWNDKVTNLKEISSKLNIGPESLVFVEDSDFEVNYVREQLPEVTVLQVPDKLYEYPGMIRDNLWLFEKNVETVEDLKKVELYKQQEKREKESIRYKDLDDYLKSLGLNLTIHIDDKQYVQRISQLTQKTNQFNLTTRRYTESEIESLIDDDNYRIFIFAVEDKFGDYGITGLAIIKIDLNDQITYVDTFLMSCRVIGRNIEYNFFDQIIKYFKKEGLKLMNAVFIRSPRNTQVEDFYDKLGFVLDQSMKNEKLYSLKIDSYKEKGKRYINVRERK